jgi:predicted Zn-dependent peptidase
MKVLLRPSSIFKKFYQKPTEITSLSYIRRIPQKEIHPQEQVVSVTEIDKSLTVITEKPRYPSNIYCSVLFPVGSRDEQESTQGVMQSLKNNYFGVKEAENFSKFQLLGSSFTMDYNVEYCFFNGFCLPHDFQDFLFTLNGVLTNPCTDDDNKKIERRHQEFWAGHQEALIETVNQEIVLKYLFDGQLANNIHGNPEIVPSAQVFNTFIQENLIENPGVLFISGVDNHEDMIEFLQPFLASFQRKKEKKTKKSQFLENESWKLCSNNYSFVNLSFEALPLMNPEFKYLEILRILFKLPSFSPGQTSNLMKFLQVSHLVFSDAAAFTLTAVLPPANLDKVSQLLADEIRNFLKTSPEDFEKAKSFYLVESLKKFNDLQTRGENFMKEFYYFKRLTTAEEMILELESLNYGRFLEILQGLVQGKWNLTVLSSVHKQKLTLNSLKSLIL